MLDVQKVRLRFSFPNCLVIYLIYFVLWMRKKMITFASFTKWINKNHIVGSEKKMLDVQKVRLRFSFPNCLVIYLIYFVLWMRKKMITFASFTKWINKNYIAGSEKKILGITEKWNGKETNYAKRIKWFFKDSLWIWKS